MIRLTDWVFAFVHGYRHESTRLSSEEKECFEPFVQENLLAKPGQVEVVIFSKPFRSVLLYFLDRTRPDLLISIRQRKWSSIVALVNELKEKHRSLRFSCSDLYRMLWRCRDYRNKLMFGIDCSKNVLAVCFTHDPRLKGSPYPWELNYINDPQEMAEVILHLNVDQSSCYFDKRCF
jgi:hypothetical protein